MQLVSESPSKYKPELGKKQEEMKEKYDLVYFELFDSGIVFCRTLHDVAAIIRYKEQEIV